MKREKPCGPNCDGYDSDATTVPYEPVSPAPETTVSILAAVANNLRRRRLFHEMLEAERRHRMSANAIQALQDAHAIFVRDLAAAQLALNEHDEVTVLPAWDDA